MMAASEKINKSLTRKNSINPELTLEQKILEIQKTHEMQQQVLLQNFQSQQLHLAEQHENQIKKYLKDYWEQQNLFKKEPNESEQAKSSSERIQNASLDVKQKLQMYLMKKRDAAAFSKNGRETELNKYEAQSIYYSNEYPLRKTASEPNLLKVKLKQRVMERRCNQYMSRRLERPLLSTSTNSSMNSAFKRKLCINNLSPGNSQSSSESPPIIMNDFNVLCKNYETSNETANLTTNKRNNELFSSPSMPNISLQEQQQFHYDNNNLSDMKTRTMYATRLGQTISGNLQFLPSLPVIESDLNEQEDMITEDTVGELQVINSSRAKTYMMPLGHRKRVSVRELGRTQSSPLPLGHPILSNDQNNHMYLSNSYNYFRHTLMPNNEIEETVIDFPDYINRSINNLSSTNSIARTFSGPTIHSKSAYRTKMTSINNKLSSDTHVITTGLAFDNQMQRHVCICNDNSNHPENPDRLHSILIRLQESGLLNNCDRMKPRKATFLEIQTCHSEAHTILYGTNPISRQRFDAQQPIFSTANFVRLPCGGVGVDADTFWNEMYTGSAARLAAGCVIDLAFKLLKGDIRNGFAIVRPPGHNADHSQAMGFCYFNSVAIATKLVRKEFGLKRIVIFDWDIHHGNGTQDIFYNDSSVLVISIHRHDDGNFFPGTGGIDECGVNEGLGFNVNIAWSGGLNPPLGDTEYVTAFENIVLPIIKDFDPEIVFVSAGFDATDGHSSALGGYQVSSACFGFMTYELMKFANGKVLLVLEGGYNYLSMCDAVEECVRVLLGNKPSSITDSELSRKPCENAIFTLQNVINTQISHWPILKKTASLIYNPFNSYDKNDKTLNLSVHQNTTI